MENKNVRIGGGTYGNVFKRVYLNKEVAVKKFKNPESGSSLREVGYLQSLNHPNLIRAITVIKSSQHAIYNVILPLYDMDLENWIKDAKEYDLHDMVNEKNFVNKIKHIFYSVIAGVNYLHNSNIMHYDIKENNILIKKNNTTQFPEVVLCDFGLMAPNIHIFDEVCSFTITHRAPETLCCDKSHKIKIGFYSDIWSLGCVGAALISGRSPYFKFSSKTSQEDCLKTIQASSVNGVEYTINDRILLRLVDRMLEWDYNYRITTKEIMEKYCKFNKECNNPGQKWKYVDRTKSGFCKDRTKILVNVYDVMTERGYDPIVILYAFDLFDILFPKFTTLKAAEAELHIDKFAIALANITFRIVHYHTESPNGMPNMRVYEYENYIYEALDYNLIIPTFNERVLDVIGHIDNDTFFVLSSFMIDVMLDSSCRDVPYKFLLQTAYNLISGKTNTCYEQILFDLFLK